MTKQSHGAIPAAVLCGEIATSRRTCRVRWTRLGSLWSLAMTRSAVPVRQDGVYRRDISLESSPYDLTPISMLFSLHCPALGRAGY